MVKRVHETPDFIITDSRNGKPEISLSYPPGALGEILNRNTDRLGKIKPKPDGTKYNQQCHNGQVM